MPTRLFLLLCLIGLVFAKKPPDVDCYVVHLEYVHCSWNTQGTPEVNYTFFSRFYHDKETKCTTYLRENGMNIGCNRPYSDRFQTFYTRLVHGNEDFSKTHILRDKVKLNPPSNLTVKNGSDHNLWFYWNQTATNCVESEVAFRKDDRKWEISVINIGKQSHNINLPSSSSRYELKVRSKLEDTCGKSEMWSEWSKPVVWKPNNSTDTMSVWTPMLCVVGAITLILLVMTLLHHERFRIIIIPAVPKPSLISHDIEDWFQFSKGLKESFKANYNERACPVREYSYASQSDSESADSSTSSVTTDQTDCSVSITVNEPEDLTTPFSSSSSTVSFEEEQQVSV